MNPAPNPDYSRLISELIKKQIVILGPDITFGKVRNIVGLHVDVNGDVERIERDPKTVFDELSNQFVELSSLIVKKTMESILQSDQIVEDEDTKSKNQIEKVDNPADMAPRVPQPDLGNQNQTESLINSDEFSLDKKINPLDEPVAMPNDKSWSSGNNFTPSFTEDELDNLNKSLKDHVIDNLTQNTKPQK